MDWNAIITKIGLIIISVVAMIVVLQALAWNYITAQEFLLIVGAILGAWGVGATSVKTFKIGKEAGYAKGFNQGFRNGWNLAQEDEKK